jgi:hypothetical protein
MNIDWRTFDTGHEDTNTGQTIRLVDTLGSVPIIIQDAIMGTGKTTSMLDKLNKISENYMKEGYIIILPYLSEIDRYMQACPGMKFKTPEVNKEGSKTKREDLIRLVRDGENILTTHAMFDSWDDSLGMLIHDNKYHIVMDEEIGSMESLKIQLKPGERKELSKLEYIEVDEKTKKVTWNFSESDDSDGTYTGSPKYAIIRKHCKQGNLYLYGDLKDDSQPFFISTIPEGFFKVGLSYEILTYRFETSDLSYFFKTSGIKYKVEYPNLQRQREIKSASASLITIIDAPKTVQAAGDGRYALSNTWYSLCLPSTMTKLRNSLGDSMKKTHKVDADRLLWTCPKLYSIPQGRCKKGETKRGYMSLRGYACTHVSWTCKGTNEHAHKDTILYMINLFPQVGIVKHISNQGYSLDQDAWSLSNMLQFIWRSAIRNNEPIRIMVPSQRMEGLLQAWLDGR